MEEARSSALLEVQDLSVSFGDVQALRGVSFSVEKGRSLAIVGESGAGKSTLALCLAGMIQPPQATGSVKVAGQQLMGASGDELRAVRWDKVALALQGAPFNPVATVGAQVAEPMIERLGMRKRPAMARAAELAEEVLLDPVLLQAYPHQLSGGQVRRALLAMTLALDPELVVLDEPTAGVDPGAKKQLIERISAAALKRGFAMIVITHDLSDAFRLAEQTMVLYAGEAMEMGPTTKVLSDPAHPYSWALVNAYPVMSTTKDLRSIRGAPPDPRAVPSGCSFHPRCTQTEQICRDDRVTLALSRDRMVACHFGGLRTLLEAKGLSKTFKTKGRKVTALDSVTVGLKEGESLGVVGPSGSGKSTFARIVSGHLAPDEGTVTLEDQQLSTSWRKTDRTARKRIQLVMQDPWDALSPRMNVDQLVSEPLVLNGLGKAAGDGRAVLVSEALASVGLPRAGEFLNAYIHQLSGGQLQRIALARALLAGPKLLVADEPTAMLDASEQARMLEVLRERQVEMGLGLILISHDMAVVRKVCDRIVVLDGGRIVEEGPSDKVSSAPASATAKALVASSPSFGLKDGLQAVAGGGNR